MKTVKIQVKCGRQLSLDKTVGSRVWRHTQGSSGRPASDLGWGSSSKTAPGSLSTGSPAGRTLPHGDGSMYSQANLRAGKCAAAPTRALPSVIVETEEELREADGSVKLVVVSVRPGVRLKNRTVRAGRSPKNTSAMSGSFIYRHHVEPRSKLYSPREESFPVPLKYIDVSRTTHTNLDVKQEKRIDDYWIIDGSRDLSDPWTGFTQFTLLEEKAPEGYMWSGERSTRKQLTSRPDHLWPEL